LVLPILQQLAKDVQEYIMSSKDWTKCMQYVAEQKKPSQLYSMQAMEAEVLLSEAFNRLELPNGIDKAAWEGFKGHAIYVAEGIERKRVRLDLPQAAKGEPPNSLDMLIKAEQSLTMPHQEDETSSMETCQWKAIKRLKNPPVTMEEMSQSLFNRTSEKDRVALQHYHNEEL